jgi:1-aminocyclopropane-1-carboxylate deaminase/D-cysteine desulfhydrase-like pyridoxal-dependent ACC family enzyme
MKKKKNLLPKLNLSITPSPLVEMKSLAEFLNVSHIYIKRDDLLGRVLGGNKLRKLEYILPLALKQNADTIITTGSFESNHVCLTAAAAKILGMHAAAVLMGPKVKRKVTLNEKIERRLGAEIKIVEFDEDDPKSRAKLNEKVNLQVEKLTDQLKAKGRKPFFVPPAGCCLEGTYSFVKAFKELHTQMQQSGYNHYDIVLPVGTGSTFSGLWCGAKKSDADVKIYGISIARKNPRCIQETIIAAKRVCKYLNLPVPKESELNITDKYIGPGYAKPTEWSHQGVETALKTEGLLLDHTYTGKALGAMIFLIKEGVLGNIPIVFWHTGGVPGAVDFFGR